MSIKGEMLVLALEAKIIEESKKRMDAYVEELNTFNIFSIGEELVGNDYTHSGKFFLVDKLFLADYFNHPMGSCRGDMPKYFVAEGYVKKANGSLGSYRTSRKIKIEENK